MKRLFILAALLCATALVSCQSTAEQDSPTAGNEVKFSASVGTYGTKVANDAFETGDAVSLTALSPIDVSGVKLTWSDGAFIPEEPIYWGRKQTDPTEFVAVYPYESAPDAQQGGIFYVSTNQSKEEDYKSSDLLLANASAAPGETVHLAFRHVLSRIDISLRSELPVASLAVENLAYSVDVYPIDGGVSTEKVGRTAAIVPFQAGNNVYSLITVPQNCTPTIAIMTADGAQITFAAPEPITLEGGCILRATVNLSAGKEVTFSSEIIPWEDYGNYTFGMDLGQPFFSVRCSGATIPMTDIGGGVYRARINDGSNSISDLCIVSSLGEELYADGSLELERCINLSTNGYSSTIDSKYGNGTFDIYYYASLKQVKITEFEEKSPDDYGFFMDDLVSEHFWGDPVSGWQVKYEYLIDSDAAVYKVVDLLSGTSPDKVSGQYNFDNGLILDGRNPEKAYIAKSRTDIGWRYLPVEIYSNVEENIYIYSGEDNDLNYGRFLNGEFTFFFPRSMSFVIDGFYYFSTNEHGQTVFVLPGYERSTYFVGDAHPSLEGVVTLEDGTSAQSIRISYLYPDNTLLRVGVFEGWYYYEDEAMLLSMARECTEPFVEYEFTPNVDLYLDISLDHTGKYTVMTYTEGADGSYYWYYYRFTFIVNGEETPELEFEVSDIHLSEIAPEKEVFFTVTGEYVGSVYASWGPADAFSFTSEEEIRNHLATDSSLMDSNGGFDNGKKLGIYGLEPGIENVVYLEITSIFGEKKIYWFTITTEPDPEWTSLGTGTYFDLLVPGLWYPEEGFRENGYTAEVEILKAVGSENKYRVIDPFGQLWSNASESLLEFAGLEASGSFDFYIVPDGETNFVRFSDYVSGLHYPADFGEGKGTLIYRYVCNGDDTPSGNPYAVGSVQIEEGVFSIGPFMQVNGIRSYVPNYGVREGVLVCLPGYSHRSILLDMQYAPSRSGQSHDASFTRELSGQEKKFVPADAKITVRSQKAEPKVKQQ